MGALNQLGNRALEEVAYTRHVMTNEFQNTARLFEAEARHVRDPEVAQAAREASWQSSQRMPYMEGSMTQLKDQLEHAVQGASAYKNEFHNSELANQALK